VMTIIFLNLGKGTAYSTFALVISILAVFLAIAYAPWMASYTETVEKHNPALTATGLAIWGWIIRVVVFVAFIIMPTIISSMNPLVSNGPVLQAKYPALALPSSTLTALSKNPTDAAALGQARAQLGPNYVKDLLSLSAATKDKSTGVPQLQAASKNAPHEWRVWYWICFGCTIFFLLTVPRMRGRWSTKKAKADEEAHEAMIQAEMAKLGLPTSA